MGPTLFSVTFALAFAGPRLFSGHVWGISLCVTSVGSGDEKSRSGESTTWVAAGWVALVVPGPSQRKGVAVLSYKFRPLASCIHALFRPDLYPNTAFCEVRGCVLWIRTLQVVGRASLRQNNLWAKQCYWDPPIHKLFLIWKQSTYFYAHDECCVQLVFPGPSQSWEFLPSS